MPYGYISNEVIYSTTPPFPVHGLGQLWMDTSVNPGVLYEAISVSPIMYAPVAGGGGGAPVDATYLTLSLNGTLTAERVLTAGSFIGFTDTGPDGTLTIDLLAHAISHAAAGSDPVDHDTLLNFVANEHINHAGVTITGINGLTGGGDITLSRTIEPSYAGVILGLANANANGVANEVARSDHQHKRDVRVASAGVDVGTRNRLNFIAGTNISLIIADDAGNDEIDVTINGTGGGGSGNFGSAVVDFGAFPGASDASVAVIGQAGIVAGSVVNAWIRAVDSADHTADEHLIETIKIRAGNIVAATGFTIYAFNENQINEPVGVNAETANTVVAAAAQPGSVRTQARNSVGGQGTRLYGQFNVQWNWG